LASLAFADDLSIFVKSQEDLTKVLKVIEDLKGVSGFEINVQKSEIIPLYDKVKDSWEMKIINCVKITGRYFSPDKEAETRMN
jgi:hypothetical protein